MRLPGTRYQEYGWEQVRKLLGHGSLQAFAHSDMAGLGEAARESTHLVLYVDLMAEALHRGAGSARARADGNSYGESVLELAWSLLLELQARPGDWAAFCAAVRAGQGMGDALLRKQVNDMYAVLRDKVDADNYQAACGRSCSPNKMYTYRMLDTAYADIARLFGAWHGHREQVAAILDRELLAEPIEARQLRSIGDCKPEWVIRWSASRERFGAGAGPLHTRSKRFASLKNTPERIGEMLAEIGDYETLSANRDQEWLHEAGDAAAWLDDLERVLQAPAGPGPDQLLAPEPEPDRDPVPERADAPLECAQASNVDEAAEQAAAASLSLPLRFMQLARAAQQPGSWTVRQLEGDSLAVRLAVYLKLLGPADATYPEPWCDPETGALPTMAQLAVLDQVSLPTLRKRRDAAIARLMAAAAP